MNPRMIPALLLTVLMGGCWWQSSAPMRPTVALVRVTPGDGSTGVRLDAGLTLDFAAVVDRGTVERGVHLIGELDMFTGPDSSMAAYGTMEAVMNDPTMLRHMDEFHSTKGKYSWNAAGTICTFQPDSLMRPQARYMVHLNGAMLGMTPQMGGTMMGGPMNSGSDMMLHFQTMN